MKDARIFFKSSNKYQSNQNQLRYLSELSKSYTKQNHFSISSDFIQSNKNRINSISSARLLDSNSSSLALKYADWSGFELEASATQNNEIYQDTTSDFKNNYSQNSITASYEAIQQGQKGINRSNSYASYHQSKAEFFSVKSNSLNNLREFDNHTINHFILLCKLSVLNTSKQLNSKAKSKVHASMKSGTMSYKDFLNFQALSNQIEVEIIKLKATIKISLNTAFKWNQKYQSFLKQKNIPTKGCQLAFKNKQVIDIQSIITKDPTIRSASEVIKQSNFEMNSINKSYLPSIKPYIQYNNGIESLTGNENQETVFGVRFTWTIPSDKSSNEKKSSVFKRAYAVKLKRQRLQERKTEVLELVSLLENNAEILNRIKDNIKTYKSLLEVLNTQISIGKSDALSYANSYTQYISLKLEALELTGSNYKIRNYLEKIIKL